MITDKIKELHALRTKTIALEQQIAAERNKDLAALPAQYGFSSAREFVAAVQAASAGGTRRGRNPGAPKAMASAAGPGRKGRRRRAKITDETRAQVKKLVAEGKTGSAIAEALGISAQSVQNIKTALGLVGKQKK